MHVSGSHSQDTPQGYKYTVRVNDVVAKNA